MNEYSLILSTCLIIFGTVIGFKCAQKATQTINFIWAIFCFVAIIGTMYGAMILLGVVKL